MVGVRLLCVVMATSCVVSAGVNPKGLTCQRGGSRRWSGSLSRAWEAEQRYLKQQIENYQEYLEHCRDEKCRSLYAGRLKFQENHIQTWDRFVQVVENNVKGNDIRGTSQKDDNESIVKLRPRSTVAVIPEEDSRP